ncbi:MAG: GNAT family N-acetyltransferase, partial [Solirubrobacteraceae bacterium]
MTSTIADTPRDAGLQTAHATLNGAADVVLRDGSTVHVRPTVTADVEAVATFLEGLSADARWFRFLGGGISPLRAARGLVDHGLGLVATAGVDGHVVAHACFVPEPNGERAELAFAVADAWQGRGIGTLMLAHLAQLAEAAGVTTLTAIVHPDNRRMLGVLRDSGFVLDVRAEPGLLEIELPAQLTTAARERFEERDRTAAVAAVGHVLRPASIAVVGASRRQSSIGGT